MSLLPSEEILYRCFDAFCRKVLLCTNHKILREEYKRRSQGCVFSDLEDGFVEKLYYDYDIYPSDSFWIDLKYTKVSLENELLHHALLLLPEKRLEIIILSYFMDMTDQEIGDKIRMPKSTVQYNRKAALRYIRKIMERNTTDEK